MTNKIIAVSPTGTEHHMSKLLADNHKNLMYQSGEKGWFYGTPEEVKAWKESKGMISNATLLNKEIEIKALQQELAEAKAMLVAQEEKELSQDLDTPPMNSKIVIGFIKSAITKEEVERIIADETRQSVLKVAKKRIVELS